MGTRRLRNKVQSSVLFIRICRQEAFGAPQVQDYSLAGATQQTASNAALSHHLDALQLGRCSQQHLPTATQPAGVAAAITISGNSASITSASTHLPGGTAQLDWARKTPPLPASHPSYCSWSGTILTCPSNNHQPVGVSCIASVQKGD